MIVDEDVSAWIVENCVIDPEAVTPLQNLSTSWGIWCINTKRTLCYPKKAWLGQRLEDRGFKRKIIHRRASCFFGIRLK